MSRAAVTIKRDLRSRMIFLTCIRILLLGPSLSHGDGHVHGHSDYYVHRRGCQKKKRKKRALNKHTLKKEPLFQSFFFYPVLWQRNEMDGYCVCACDTYVRAYVRVRSKSFCALIAPKQPERKKEKKRREREKKVWLMILCAKSITFLPSWRIQTHVRADGVFVRA